MTPPFSKKKRNIADTTITCICLDNNSPEFGCPICKKVLTQPLTTPCAHNFCKECLLGSYADKSFMRERTREGGRTLRAQKIVKKCPSCPTDIAEFLQNPEVPKLRFKAIYVLLCSVLLFLFSSGYISPLLPYIPNISLMILFNISLGQS